MEVGALDANPGRRKAARLLMASPPKRIACIGMGPKGLYCLERLAMELWNGTLGRDLEIHLFEPHPFPGAGPVYDPRQPSFLRMNFANRHVDMWSRGPEALPFHRPTLVEWLAEHRPELANEDGYAPRGVVGEYLYAGFLSVMTCLRDLVPVTWHQTWVEEIVRGTGGWKIRPFSSKLIPSVERTVDEVMIATGHASQRTGGDVHPHPRVIPAVYPVDRYLGLEKIPAGATVAMRGLWRTAIDATLALFEGRGGYFEAGDRLSKLTYHGSPQEVAKVLPYSRSGRAMAAKPDPRYLPPVPALEEVWQEGAQRLFQLAAEPQSNSVGTLVEILATTASRALEAVEGKTCDLREQLTSLVDTGEPLSLAPASPAALESAMEASLEVAYGERPRDAEWAMGQTWQKLYPGLVDLAAVGALGPRDWPQFSNLAREMGRLAFGPPAENAARFLALVRAGKVDLRAVAGPRIDVLADHVELRTPDTVYRADCLVNAVLAPPGAGTYRSSLIDRLVEDGHVDLVANSEGVRVAADGSCIGASGAITPGLAMVGRPTEGSVLGNDTLSRTLHSHPARWASGLAQRLCSGETAAEPGTGIS